MSETEPFFTVVIPTYNRAHSILDAVKSVLVQSFEDFELLVVDDGSTDQTEQLIRTVAESDSRVKYIFQKNAERSAARNHGIELARGIYICFLDSDDIYRSEHLKSFHAKIVSSNNPIAMLMTTAAMQTKTGIVYPPQFVPNTNEPLELILKASICSQQVCIHYSILQEFRFDVGLKIGEDQELWSRIVRNYPLIKLSNHTVVIRDLGDRTIDIKNVENSKSNLLIKKRIIAADHDDRIQPEWRKFILSAAYYRLAKSQLACNEYARFYFNLTRSILIYPTHYWKEKVALSFTVFRSLIGRSAKRKGNN